MDDWDQVAGRRGGTIGRVVLEEGLARVPVWLAGTDLVVVKRSWSLHPPIDLGDPVSRQRSLLYCGVGVELFAFAVYEVGPLLVTR